MNDMDRLDKNSFDEWESKLDVMQEKMRRTIFYPFY
jgi:hypothetical protein